MEKGGEGCVALNSGFFLGGKEDKGGTEMSGEGKGWENEVGYCWFPANYFYMHHRCMLPRQFTAFQKRKKPSHIQIFLELAYNCCPNYMMLSLYFAMKET